MDTAVPAYCVAAVFTEESSELNVIPSPVNVLQVILRPKVMSDAIQKFDTSYPFGFESQRFLLKR